MAQLSIRDKDYRPNQYLNPMLISGGREANPEDRPYRIFDKTNPEHPDFEGNKKDDGPEFEQMELDLVKGKKNKDMTIAGGAVRPQDFIPFTPATRDNDGFAMPYLRTPELRQEEMKHFIRFINNYRDGMVQRNTPMLIAKKGKKKRNAQRAYEDFVRDSQGMGIEESFKDLRRGIDGEGLDIMKDVLGLDEV
jgi:hypothetical protein